MLYPKYKASPVFTKSSGEPGDRGEVSDAWHLEAAGQAKSASAMSYFYMYPAHIPTGVEVWRSHLPRGSAHTFCLPSTAQLSQVGICAAILHIHTLPVSSTRSLYSRLHRQPKSFDAGHRC